MTTANASTTALAKAKATALDHCEFCEKTGLAILPVRIAIMHPDAGAPELPNDLYPVDSKGGKRLSLEGPAAAYTARTLRKGYLYVYDERGTWEKYWITEHGYLMKTPVSQAMSGAYTAGREPCDKTGHKEIAACITVKDPKHAKRIWVGYSEAEWTPRVLERHQSEAYRQRHMRVFDVQKWMSSHQGSHAQALDRVSSVVAEYSPKAKVETFAFSQQAFHSRASTKDSLLQAAATLGPQPAALLVIDDPTGIATEIGARAVQAHEGFMARDERSRKLAVSTAILGLQGAVSDRSELNEIAAGDQLDEDGHLVPDGLGRLRYVANPPRLPTTTAADLSWVSAQSWSKYVHDYDERARSQWQKEFEKEYSRFTEETLWSLAKCHVRWMTSEQMHNYLDCNYDGASAEVGLVYTRVLATCIRGTEQFAPCAQLYEQWLNGVMSDEKNIVLRGIVLNLERNRKHFVQSLQPDVAWEAIGWDGLFGGFNNAIDGVAKQAHDELSGLLTSLDGSIARVLQSAVDGPVRHGLVACGVVSGRPVVPVSLTGTYKAYRASLILQLLKASGVRKMGENAMQREVSLALRRLQIRGEPMKATVSSTFLVMIDEETIKGMPKGLTKSEQAKWLAGAVRSADEIEKLNLSAWRERVSVPDLSAKTVKAAPLIGNVLAGLFQWAAYQKVSQDLASSMSNEKQENQDRLRSAVIAMGATVADSIARATGYVAETPLLKGWAASLRTTERWMGRASKAVGIVAAGIGAFWDLRNARAAAEQKSYGLSATLLISAVSGFAAAVLAARNGVIAVIVATLVFIGTGVIATLLQDDKIKKWLKRCYWGVLDKKDHYQDLEVEMNDLSIATGS